MQAVIDPDGPIDGILFLHGIGIGPISYAHILRALVTHFGGLPVLAIELPAICVRWCEPGHDPDSTADAVAALVRQHGWFDAKNMLAADVSVLSDAADAVLVRREEEAKAAAEAAALAEAEAEAAAAEEASIPVAAPVAAAPAGAYAALLDAIKRSPVMLELAPSAKGLAAVDGMVSIYVGLGG